MIQQRRGSAVPKWRRGYADGLRGSFSTTRGTMNATLHAHDLPVSFYKSIGSIAGGGAPSVQGQVGKDCMERVTPYYIDTIQKAMKVKCPGSVLGDWPAIMHLCEIPEDRVPEIKVRRASHAV